MNTALGTGLQDPAIGEKVLSVAEDPFFKKSFNGRVDSIMKALVRSHLEEEVTPTPCPFSTLAHILKNDLLNPSTRLETLPVSLHVGPGERTTTVWPRTAMSFMILARHLKCTIVIFSSTEQPRQYSCDLSRGTIPLIHKKQALDGGSIYSVLKVIMTPTTSSNQVLSESSPQRPSGFPPSSQSSSWSSALWSTAQSHLRSPPILSGTDSISSTIELSTHVLSLSSSEWPPLPSSQKAKVTPCSSTAAAATITSSSSSDARSPPLSITASGSAIQGPPLATFRATKRRIQYPPRDSRAHLTEEKLKISFARACDEKAKQEVEKEVDRLWRKRKRTETFEDVYCEQKKSATLESLSGKPSLPQGLVDRATDIVKSTYPNTDTFRKHNLTTQLDTLYRQEQYRNSLRTNFNDAWNTAISRPNPERNPATSHQNSDINIENFNEALVEQGGLAVDNSGDLLPDGDEAAISEMIEREAREREKKRLLTVTVPLKDIIRKELHQTTVVVQESNDNPGKEMTAAQKMYDVLRSKQEILTNAVDELACLVRKTTLLLAQNAFTVPDPRVPTTPAQGTRKQFQQPTFNICTSLIPSTFTPRTNSSPTVAVAPLPSHLSQYIDASTKGPNQRWISDLRELFSYHHLGFLYSSFFSPHGFDPDSDKKHPLWAELAKSLEGPPLSALDSSWKPGQPHPMSGLATVFTDYRVEFATNIANLWSGPLFSKALDFLLRFSLRFQLAPERELKYYTRVRDLAKKKMEQRERDNSRSMTFKAWKDRAEQLQQDLGELAAQDRTGTDRFQTLMSLLKDHVAKEPKKDRQVDNGSIFGHADTVEETRLMLEATEEALDEVDEDEEDEEQQAETSTSARPKEPSRAHLKTVQAVTKILLESPNLDVPSLNSAWVRRTAHRPEEFTDADCAAVVNIVKSLAPYTPKRVSNASGSTAPPTANAATMIRIVLISNHFLQYSGYGQFARRFAPAPSVASLHPIPLGAAALYETLCWKAPNNFDIYDKSHKPIASVITATKNQTDVFDNFFDIEAIHGLCRKYKLRFAFRLTFVNRHTVRVLGEAIPEGQERGQGGPVISMLDEQKKDRTKRRAGTDWGREGHRTGITQAMATQRLVDTSEISKNLEGEQKERRRLWLVADNTRHNAAVRVREIIKFNEQEAQSINPKREKPINEKQAEADLQAARKNADAAFMDWMRKDEDLRLDRATRYALQRIAKTKPSTDPPSTTRPNYEARPTWSHPAGEATTECLYINCALDAAKSDRTKGIGFTADDPRLVKMTTSVTSTLTSVTQSIRQYTVQTQNRFNLLAQVDELEPPISSEEQEQATVAIPPVRTVTAEQIDSLSLTTKNRQKRQKKLAAHTPDARSTRDALKALSDSSINFAETVDEVEASQEIRRQSRQPCREFENAPWRIHDLRTQELTTRRVYTTLAARQRQQAKDMVLAESATVAALGRQRQESEKPGTTITNTVETVVLDATSDVIEDVTGSTGKIKGAELEEDVMVQETQLSAGSQDDLSLEAMSTKSKRMAFEGVEFTTDTGQKGLVSQKKNIIPVVLHGAAGTAVGSRIKGHVKRGGSKMTQQHRQDGETKTMRLNGSVECKNPTCPRRKDGRGSMGRDANAANNILISGTSILLSADHKALPPYRPYALPTTTMTARNTLKVTRFCMRNMPQWVFQQGQKRATSNRPQCAFLDLIEDTGSVRPAHQPSLTVKAPEDITPTVPSSNESEQVAVVV
ncbi:hypothetical protein BGZ90_002382 [Linnemannia elongata]|nr:hypothetical protein BGZ90_002382 [Linnemannia elongata]